ncbi:uncharacterized protein LAJ45_07233 [Morchella importuna]|uniref:uncharacterized protein n=1 Tax=Morchella importuna TaxID=1174673 RepID=UPI001E8D74EC|nr:uncharacterized protein LAJ45_07233 [Morchella importuna]KAH8148889.1 hypothetical protein LAJ45_07233 [Morchella importuna]
MAHRFSAHEAAQQGGKSFYAGVVRLRFESFAASPKYLARELSIKNIERLKTIFRTDGVLSRENPLNRIPILLTATALTSALEKAGIGKDDINGDPPYHQLPMPKGSVPVSSWSSSPDGRQRHHPTNGSLWGVDIYIEGSEKLNAQTTLSP